MKTYIHFHEQCASICIVRGDSSGRTALLTARAG
jgi:hypothetical protein